MADISKLSQHHTDCPQCWCNEVVDLFQVELMMPKGTAFVYARQADVELLSHFANRLLDFGRSGFLDAVGKREPREWGGIHSEADDE